MRNVPSLFFVIFYLFYSITLWAMCPRTFHEHISYFDIETIKETIRNDKINGDAIMRSAFPEEVWNLAAKPENPNDYVKNAAPIKYMAVLQSKIILAEKYRDIKPLEEEWLKSHRDLHNFLVNHVIKRLIEKQKELSTKRTKEWQKEYIDFFFGQLSTMEGGYNPQNYTSNSPLCPQWLKPSYLSTIMKLPTHYDDIFEKLEQYHQLMMRIKTYDATNTAKAIFTENGYRTLQSFTERLFQHCGFCEQSLKSGVGEAIHDFFNKQKAGFHNLEDTFIYENLADHLLKHKEKLIVRAKSSCQFNFENLTGLLVLY